MKPSKKKRAAMDNLSKDELRSEINQGKESRFSRSISYMEDLLARIQDEEMAEERSEDVAIASEANRLSRDANTISAKAHRLSIWAILIICRGIPMVHICT